MAKKPCFPLISITFGCLGLASCAVGPDFKTPNAPNVQSYVADVPLSSVTAKGQRLLPGQVIPEQWWKLYQCPELDQLIELGVANSPNIEAAQAALRIAKDNYYAQIGSTMFPAVNAAGAAQREQFTLQEFGLPTSQETLFNLFNTQLNVSYTLDIFGGSRRSIEALRALVDYQQFELEATYLTLVTNIVNTAMTEATLRAQIKATHGLIQSQAKQLEIIQGQFQLGGASQSEVLTQKTLLAQTQAQLPPLEKNLALNRHLLALLIGELPSENRLPEFDLDSVHLPENIPLSLPSLLVRKRPDVRASEALLHQASAQIGVATANMLPQFTITGYYGWTSDLLNNLYTPGNVVWDIAANAAQPLFQGGSLFMRRKAAIDTFDQMRAQYRQVVLQAFQNVADTLRALEIDAQTLLAQETAEKAAFNTLVMTERQYKLGAVPYLTLLNAEHQYQLTLINRIQAQGARYTDTAALFQALGGGWWNCENQPA